jgi:hypothetical protein
MEPLLGGGVAVLLLLLLLGGSSARWRRLAVVVVAVALGLSGKETAVVSVGKKGSIDISPSV